MEDLREKVSEGTEKVRQMPGAEFVRDVVISLLIVAAVGAGLYIVSGVWPPMVAIESGSMEPHIGEGDLVFVVEPTKFSPDGVDARNGIVTYEEGEDGDYRSFGSYGDVIVYQPDGNPRQKAVIHRAMRYVEEGEKWRSRNGVHVAEHSGFLTKGDDNMFYDQDEGISSVVKPEWVKAKGKFGVPYLGRIRLLVPFTLSPSRMYRIGSTAP